MESGTVELPQGTISYRRGGSGAPAVLVHGLLVNGRLWDGVVEELEASAECVVPDLPLGSHRTALDPAADLSPLGLAKLIDDFISELGLEEVTLVGNDTGGALCQILATQHPGRVGRLGLTNCDAYENFLPLAFRYLQGLARLPGGVAAVAQTMRPRFMRRAPIAYGWLTKYPIEPNLLDEWVTPVIGDGDVRRDVTKVLRGISKRYTVEAAERLRDFDRPARVIWGTDDRFFPAQHAERLAATLPNGRLVMVADGASFLPLDQPRRVAQEIAELAAG